jgi:hypothetical protein
MLAMVQLLIGILVQKTVAEEANELYAESLKFQVAGSLLQYTADELSTTRIETPRIHAFRM